MARIYHDQTCRMPFEINEYFKAEFIIINADTPVIDGTEQTYQDHVSNMKARLTHAQVLGLLNVIMI